MVAAQEVLPIMANSSDVMPGASRPVNVPCRADGRAAEFSE